MKFDFLSLRREYEDRQVLPRFFHRHYEKISLFIGGESQASIHLLLSKFLEGKIEVITSNSLARYLMKVEGLRWARKSGNQRWWYGLRRRAEPLTGSIASDSPELTLWEPMEFEGSEDPPFADGHLGRPYRGERATMPLRPDELATIKGYRWSLIYRSYRQLSIVSRFAEKYVDRTDPDSLESRETVWQAFDKFCQLEKIPTCSAIRLKDELRVREVINLDGSRDWKGIKLQVKS